jgi:hypothetical protein
MITLQSKSLWPEKGTSAAMVFGRRFVLLPHAAPAGGTAISSLTEMGARIRAKLTLRDAFADDESWPVCALKQSPPRIADGKHEPADEPHFPASVP